MMDRLLDSLDQRLESRGFMDVIVVGGGPGGMMAAIQAAHQGHRVRLLEKNKSLGRKLFITGKGRCNVTNDRDISEFFQNIPRNSEFLYSALYTFSNRDLMDFLKARRLKLKVERGQRVFPESDKSSDVIKVFERELSLKSVAVRFNCEVTKVVAKDGRIIKLMAGKETFQADHYIFATGGASYPLTGSDGKMRDYLSECGIDSKRFQASLIPLKVKEGIVKELAGISLRNVGFKLTHGKKVFYEDLGELLFTHDGLSGPLVLTASCFRPEGFCQAVIDLKPALDAKALEDRILRDFAKYQNKEIKNGLGDLLISRLVPVILANAAIEGEKKIHSVTREERQRLVSAIKEFSFEVIGTRPLAEAIISRGGILPGEIDPSTMKLKKLTNASVCGELVDVDAFTGGFNLQIAFSTGFLAGDSL